MKAAVIDRLGEPAEVLRPADVPAPEPRSGEVLVRMIASPINPSDLMTVRGQICLQPALPFMPGYEGVGVVESSGGGLLGGAMKGRRVAVLNQAGGNWAEYAVVPANRVIPVSDKLPDVQVASLLRQPGHRPGDGPSRPEGPQGRLAPPVGGRLGPGQDDHPPRPARRLQDAERRPPQGGDRRVEAAGRRRGDLVVGGPDRRPGSGDRRPGRGASTPSTRSRGRPVRGSTTPCPGMAGCWCMGRSPAPGSPSTPGR